MSKLTASVIGGGAGGGMSLQGLASSDLFELLAVADLKPEVLQRLQKEYPGIRTFPSHEEMLAAVPVDVVCVSTYPPSHEQITMDALKLPLKGILVEKPLGHTAASGRNIIHAIRKAGIPVAVPHGLLAKRTPLEIIQRVQNGEIGDLNLVEIQCTGWDIINCGIHWMDFFVTMTGNEPIHSVMALCDSTTRTWRDGMQVETSAVTYVQTQSGIRAVMNTGDHVIISQPSKGTIFRIVGDKGIIEFWGWENGYYIQNGAHPNGDTIIPSEYAVTFHQRHLENMAAEINHGKPDYRIAEASLMALEVCEAAYTSSKHCCEVFFPLSQFTAPEPVDWEPGQPYSGKGGGRDGRALE